MITIEKNKFRQNILGELKNIPPEVLRKLNISSTYLNQSTDNLIEVVIVSGESVDKVKDVVDNLGGFMKI